MKPLQTFFAGLVVLFMMGACAQSINPPAPDTQSSPTAAITLTAGPTPTPSASITPIPPPTRRLTDTVTPSLTPLPSITPGGPTLTFTPSHTPTSTAFSIPPPLVFKWTLTPMSFQCKVITISPPWGKIVPPRTDFIASWRIYNSGTSFWRADDIVFGYVSGERMHNRDRGETLLPETIYKGDKINLQVHMKPPKEPGYYTTTFGLRKTNKPEPFCTFSVSITVAGKK